jgi:hypothetical protein
MEPLFSPSTRLYDILANRVGRTNPYGLPAYNIETVKELNLDVSTEEFLSAERAFTYAGLKAMLGDGETYAWLTPHAFVVPNTRVSQSWMQLHARPHCTFTFDADGKEIVAWARSPPHLLEICDVVLRLLAASVVHSLILNKLNRPNTALTNAPTLANLIEQCQSLKSLVFENLAMDENHCRVLGAYSRPGLEIELFRCTITGSGASALVEILKRNQGLTKLDDCNIDNMVIADGLRGNRRLKSFSPDFSENLDICKRQVLEIVNAVRENKGLVQLNLRSVSFSVNDETWGAVCDSLKTHPTLEVLDLQTPMFIHGTRDRPPPAPNMITFRTQALVDMLRVNTSVHTIHVDSCFSEHEIYRESVIPYLMTNRFRPRLLAIQKTRPIVYRTKVLGRALLVARTDANSFWMLLSGNAEVAFPPRTMTIAAAANLPAPAVTAATSTANVAAVATSVMSTLTTTATGNLPTAAAATSISAVIPSNASASDAFASARTVTVAANVATPSTGQKRKACP